MRGLPTAVFTRNQMIRSVSACFAALLFSAFAVSAQAPPALAVVNYGPRGEIASLDEANEIRIVFSEPMVTLGRIPEQVSPPYIRITPAIPGTYRWSGTTTLI